MCRSRLALLSLTFSVSLSYSQIRFVYSSCSRLPEAYRSMIRFFWREIFSVFLSVSLRRYSIFDLSDLCLRFNSVIQFRSFPGTSRVSSIISNTHDSRTLLLISGLCTPAVFDPHLYTT